MLKEIKHVYVFGLGAIGAKYASMIYDVSPQDIYVIVDEERKLKYDKDGIYVNDKKYNFKFTSTPLGYPPADLIIIGVKSLDIEIAMSAIKDYVNSDTIILSLLNGIRATDFINTFFPNQPAVNSIVYMDAVKLGNKINYSHRGKVVFGEQNNILWSNRVNLLSSFFDNVGIDYEVPEDMTLALWRKFLINVVGNQLTYVLDVGYEGLQDNPYVLNLVQAVGEEVIKIANAQNINLTQLDIDNMISTMRKINPKAKTSMVQDRFHGRTSEVDIFAGEILTLGEKLNIKTPYNFMLYNLIKGYEFEKFDRK